MVVTEQAEREGAADEEDHAAPCRPVLELQLQSLVHQRLLLGSDTRLASRLQSLTQLGAWATSVRLDGRGWYGQSAREKSLRRVNAIPRVEVWCCGRSMDARANGVQARMGRPATAAHHRLLWAPHGETQTVTPVRFPPHPLVRVRPRDQAGGSERRMSKM